MGFSEARVADREDCLAVWKHANGISILAPLQVHALQTVKTA